MISPGRRTTIVVSDMETSLRFYRDLLGMNLFYDQQVAAEATGRLLGVPGAKVRIVSLQSDDSTTGMVGLLSFIAPDLKPRRQVPEATSEPDVLMLFMAEDIDILATYACMKAAEVQIVSAPVQYEVPERGMICGFTCKDPDGITVALMRFGDLQQPGGEIKASPIRRTTIVVNDMERSLSFYREVMGMRVFYDQEISSPEEGLMLGIPGTRVRIVSLQSGEAVEGMVGLISILDRPAHPRAQIRKLISEPDIALVYVTDEIEAVHAKLENWGAKIQSAPVAYEIPGRGMCVGLSAYDPNGVMVEFTQFGPLKST